MDRKEIQRRCIRDILFFGRSCIPALHDTPTPEFHREIARDLQGAHRYLNFIAPRGHAKTTLTAVVYVLWHIFCEDLSHGRKPEPKLVLLVSKSRGHSINVLTSIKNILEFNQHFRAIWGYHGAQVAPKWREDYIELPGGHILIAKGWEQQIRGINIKRRPSLIVTDDIETEENTKTAETVLGNSRKYEQAIFPAVANRTGRIVNIGTPQVSKSLVFEFKAMSSIWRTRHYKAINARDDGSEYALWPEAKPLDELKAWRDALEARGRVSSFYREYQCEVIGDNDQLFKPEYIKHWHGTFEKDLVGMPYLNLTDGEEPRRVPIQIFMGIDPASSLAKTADYTAIAVIGMDSERNVYVLDMIRRRMQPIEVAHAIIATFRQWRPSKTQIETTGYQEMLRDYLRKESGVYIPGLEIKNNPRRGKASRLEGLQGVFAMGKVFLRAADHALENELLLFPRAEHDDTIDALYYAHKGAYPPFHDLVTSKELARQKSAPTYYDWMLE